MLIKFIKKKSTVKLKKNFTHGLDRALSKITAIDQQFKACVFQKVFLIQCNVIIIIIIIIIGKKKKKVKLEFFQIYLFWKFQNSFVGIRMCS